MSEDFYPFVDSGDPAPDNTHLTGGRPDKADPAMDDSMGAASPLPTRAGGVYTTRISVYDDMLSTPRVIVVEQSDVRTYLEDVTNTVHRTMKEQGGRLSLMIIRELVENFIHAQFSEPVISILDNGDTIRFADQGPGINDKERAFEFGVTSADKSKKRYIRGTGAGLPMVQQYVEAAGGAISVEDNLGSGTVVTVSVDPARVAEIERAVSRGAAVRSGHQEPAAHGRAPQGPGEQWQPYGQQGVPQPQGMPGMPPAADPSGTAGAWPQAVPGTPGAAAESAYGIPGAQWAPYYQQGNPWMGGVGAWPSYANPYGAPQPYPPMGGFPPNMAPGSYPAAPQMQAAGMARGAGMAGGSPADAQRGASSPYVSDRGALALRYIAQNGKGGPTDLTRAFGNSDATWSRELDALAGTGLIHKRGQKYMLTELGQGWSQQ